MNVERPVRWTADCWQHGCGWSIVGFDVDEMQAKVADHVAEKHP